MEKPVDAMENFALEKSIPKYLRIRSWLQNNISKGNISPGEKLPTEEELARIFQVNRMTVRKAIDELVSEQMVTRKPGVGTFLVSRNPKHFTYNIGSLDGLINDIRSFGIEPTIVNVKKEKIEPPSRLRSILNLEKDEYLLSILRVVFSDQEPIVISRSYLPYNAYKAFMKMELNDGLYDLLTNKYNAKMHHSYDIFSVAMPDKKEIKLFKNLYQGPCIKLESTVYNPKDQPIGIFQAIFRGDKYRFKFASAELIFKNKQFD
jgi:GntR family transcriptional regulator